MPYRRRNYRFGRRRNRFFRKRARNGSIRRRALRRTNLRPEVKYKDNSVSRFEVDATSPWSLPTVVHSSVMTQGTANGEMIGEMIRMRFIIIRFTINGAETGDTNQNFVDGLFRMVLYTPIQDNTHVQAYINAQTDINVMWDYNRMMVIKDMKFSLGKFDSTAKQFSKDIQVVVPWTRNAKLRPATGSPGNFFFDEQKDSLFVTFFAGFNDAHIGWSARITYIDN